MKRKTIKIPIKLCPNLPSWEQKPLPSLKDTKKC